MSNQCTLAPNCGLSNENKKDKNHTRLIECRICLKQWHSFCVGYQNMKEGEFNEQAKTFVCNKCHFFVNAVSDIVAEKVYNKINETFTQLQNKITDINSTLTKTLSEEIRASVDTLASKSHKVKDLDTSIKLHTNNANNITVGNCKNDNSEIDYTDRQTDGQDENIEFRQVKATRGETFQSNEMYLCSIEKGLSKSDILFILEDAKVHVSNIELIELEGDFKKKRFIKVFSKESIDLFKFKLSFNRSNLNGTWFIRATPPRSPIQRNNEKKHIIKNPTATGKLINDTNDATEGHKEQTKPVFHKFENRRHTNEHQNTNRRKYHSYAHAAAPDNESYNYNNNSQPNSNISQADFQHFLATVLQTVLHR